VNTNCAGIRNTFRRVREFYGAKDSASQV
jgi:hypothetical protein